MDKLLRNPSEKMHTLLKYPDNPDLRGTYKSKAGDSQFLLGDRAHLQTSADCHRLVETVPPSFHSLTNPSAQGFHSSPSSATHFVPTLANPASRASHSRRDASRSRSVTKNEKCVLIWPEKTEKGLKSEKLPSSFSDLLLWEL